MMQGCGACSECPHGERWQSCAVYVYLMLFSSRQRRRLMALRGRLNEGAYPDDRVSAWEARLAYLRHLAITGRITASTEEAT